MTIEEIKKAQQIAQMLRNRIELGEEYVRVDDLNSVVEAISEAVYRANQQDELAKKEIAKTNTKIDLLGEKSNAFATTKDVTKLSTELKKDIQGVVDDFSKQVIDIREFVTLFEKYDPTELVGIIEMNADEITKVKQYLLDIGETSESIRNKLETLNGNERLSAKYISGLEEIINEYIVKNNTQESDKYVSRGGGNVEVFSDGVKVGSGQGINFGTGFTVTHDGGVATITGGSGSGVTVETPTGTVNGSNTSFTVSATPKWIIGDGIVYFENAGYTLSGLTVTMTSAPWSYIRAII